MITTVTRNILLALFYAVGTLKMLSKLMDVSILVVWPFGKSKGMTLLSKHGTFWCRDPIEMDKGKEYHLKPTTL